MNTPRILIVYATSYGQTEKIARRMGEILTAKGCQVTLADAARSARGMRAADFDGVIVGASIIARGHQPAARAFIRNNVADLNRLPSAFFSVCASAGSTFERSRAAAARLRDAFLSDVAWQPDVAASIAGAVNFTRYNFVLRWYMKRASAMNGGATDTSRDHEYTDWAQVEHVALDFASIVRGTEVAVPAS